MTAGKPGLSDAEESLKADEFAGILPSFEA